MRNFFLLPLILFFGSCSTNTQQNKNKIPQEKFPVIIDTVQGGMIEISSEEHWMSTANYFVWYIGKKTHTIYLPLIYRTGTIFLPPGSNMDYDSLCLTRQDYFRCWVSPDNYKSAKSSKVRIQIDTTQKIKNSLPVIITNLELDTIKIGHGDYLPLLLEAKDKDGKWKPIQDDYIYGCGNGIGNIILPPGEIVLTRAPDFKGPFKTQLRLALGKNYSPVFNGSIFPNQFKKKFNERGEYRKEYLEELEKDNI